MVNVEGRGSKTADKRGKGIFEEVNLGKYWQDVLGKYSPNSCKGWMAIVVEGTKNTYLTSESRESELKGARCSPMVEKGNLALNKKEKKKERHNHPLRIKCIATT